MQSRENHFRRLLWWRKSTFATIMFSYNPTWTAAITRLKKICLNEKSALLECGGCGDDMSRWWWRPTNWKILDDRNYCALSLCKSEDGGRFKGLSFALWRKCSSTGDANPIEEFHLPAIFSGHPYNYLEQLIAFSIKHLWSRAYFDI